MNTESTGRKHLIFVGLSLLAFAVSAAGAGMPKTNLITFLSHWREPGGAMTGITCELQPQWVGTVKRAYARDPRNISRANEPNDIRFTHLFVARRFGAPLEEDAKPQLKITRSRSGSDGKLKTMIGGETPAFMRNLPSVESVAKAANLAGLTNLFGRQHGGTGAWGGPDRWHWTEGWTWFTVEATNRLRYMSIFAHVSSADRSKPADIDTLVITEGYFRPANPNSREEFTKYKTGEDDFAEYQRQKAEARAKFPQPLRSFLEARETPDDSDWHVFKRTLNRVRANPDPELFVQLVTAMEQDNIRFGGLLEHILLDERLKLEPWQPGSKKVAVRALADAIPHAKSKYALRDALVLFLRTQGGGELPRAGIKVPGEGAGCSYGSDNLPANIVEAAALMYGDIKDRYPHVWAD